MPFSLEQLRALKTAVIHGPQCPDGIASAILLHDVLPDVEIKFVQYGAEHESLVAVPGMLFADINPPQGKGFVEAGTLVLDHHKGVKEWVTSFGANGVFADETEEPGVCGAVLVYRHVWLPLQAERAKAHGHRMTSIQVAEEESAAKDFAYLAGIRDTWQNKSPDWQKACIQAEMLRFYPIEYWLDQLARPFDPAVRSMWAERRQIASMLLEKHAKSVERAIEKAHRFTTSKGTKVIVFEGTHLTSDMAEKLDHEVDLVIGFGFLVENGEQKITVSTRSHTGYDCCDLAKFYGGGGHTAAAGFNSTLHTGSPQPYQLVELLIGDRERSKFDAPVTV
jgi:hypothetical protein